MRLITKHIRPIYYLIYATDTTKQKKCPTFVASSVCRSRVQIFPLLVVPTFIVLTFVSVYRLDVSGAVILFLKSNVARKPPLKIHLQKKI